MHWTDWYLVIAVFAASCTAGFGIGETTFMDVSLPRPCHSLTMNVDTPFFRSHLNIECVP